jgi:cardiolipin synthase
MRRILVHLPNLLSAVRVALVPTLWILAFRGEATAVGAGLVLAGMTDAVDGTLARRLGVDSPAGAALDSLGDNLLALSGAVWLVMLRPDVAARFAVPLAVWGTLYVTFLVIGLVKFRRFGNLHLYSAKVAGAAAYLFATLAFLFPGVPMALGWLAFGTAVIAVAEGIACQALCDDIDESVGSVARVLARRRAGRRAEVGARPSGG